MSQLKSLRAQLKTAVISLPADTPIINAVREMQRYNVGALLVMGNNGKPIGIFTERDLLKKISHILDYNAWNKPLGLVTTKPLKTLPLVRLSEAGDFMLNHHIRHLPLTHNKEIVAMVSMRDLFQNLLKTGEVSFFDSEGLDAESQRRRKVAVVGTTETMFKALLKLLEYEGAPHSFRVMSYDVDEFRKAVWRSSGKFPALDACIIDLDLINAGELATILRKIEADAPSLGLLMALYSPQKHDTKALLAFEKSKAGRRLKFMAKPIKLKDFYQALSSF